MQMSVTLYVKPGIGFCDLLALISQEYRFVIKAMLAPDSSTDKALSLAYTSVCSISSAT